MLFALASCRGRGLFWGLSSSLRSIVLLLLQPLTAALRRQAQPSSPPSSLALPNKGGAAGASDHAGWAGQAIPLPEQALWQN